MQRRAITRSLRIALRSSPPDARGSGLPSPRYSLSNPQVQPRLLPAASVRLSHMASNRHLVLAAGLLGLCTLAAALLIHGGHVTVPRRERAALRGARAAVHGELERLESVVPAGRIRDNGLWRAYLDLVEKELALGHVDVAVRVWHDAYGAALASGSWESMIAVDSAAPRRSGCSTIAPSANSASTSPRCWRRGTNKRSRG